MPARSRRRWSSGPSPSACSCSCARSRRLGGADRHRGHRERRARRSSRRSRRTPRTRCSSMAVLLGVIFIGITFIADAYDDRPVEALSGGPTVIALVAADRLRRRDAAVLRVPGGHRADPVPRREHVVQRVPAPRRAPRRRTATCRASSRSAAIGSRTAGASCCWRASRSPCSSLFGGNTTLPDPALLRRRVRVLHAQPGRAWSATGSAAAEPGWRWRLGDQRVRRAR